jgi:hypothetical protein
MEDEGGRWKVEEFDRQQASAGTQVGASGIRVGLFSPSRDDYTSVNFEQSKEAESGKATCG